MFRTGVPHFGASGRPTSMNESALIRSGDILKIYEEGTNRWQIVQIVDAANVAVGDALYWKSKAAGTVTPTIGNSSAGELAGFAEVIATAANYYIALRQGGLFSCKANGLFARGTEIGVDSGNNRVVPFGNIAKLALAQVDTGGGALSWQSPYTDDIFVTRLVIDVTTACGDGTATVDAGTTAASATTSSNNLLTALNVHTAAGAFDNYVNPGASGKAMQRLTAAKWVTISKAAGTIVDIVGNAYITLVRSASVSNQKLGVAQGAINAGKVSVMLDIVPA